jgi:transposase
MATSDEMKTPAGTEVPMIDAEEVRQIRELARRKWGAKRIARELGIARNTVRRYLRGGEAATRSWRPGAQALDEAMRRQAIEWFNTIAEGNAVVVQRELRDRGVAVSIRTVQRVVAERRREQRVLQVATVRFETAPGHQMQIDFGEKHVAIGGHRVRVFFMTAVLGYSRRMFVKAFLSQRQDDWREGLVGAFRHFGGVTQTLLMDNAGALVVGRDATTQTVTFHPAFAQFCCDWDVTPRACRPYRARTKGKTEAGVKYVKRNAVAGRSFESFAALEAHLTRWMREADQRVHGTTHELPTVRFDRDEHQALRPLPARALPVRERRISRRVAADCLVDVDTIRYSVPHRLVRDRVEVKLDEREVRIYHGVELVAVHARSFEPHSRVVDKTHYEGIWRTPTQPSVADTTAASPLAALGRTLDDYARIVDGGAQ